MFEQRLFIKDRKELFDHWAQILDSVTKWLYSLNQRENLEEVILGVLENYKLTYLNLNSNNFYKMIDQLLGEVENKIGGKYGIQL